MILLSKAVVDASAFKLRYFSVSFNQEKKRCSIHCSVCDPSSVLKQNNTCTFFTKNKLQCGVAYL